MNDEQRYLQTVAAAQRLCRGPVGRAILDRVLDALLVSPAVAEIRRSSGDQRWVSALHVLTERLLDREVRYFQSTDNESFGLYKHVSSCVIVLEAEGLVHVTRDGDNLPWKANPLIRIEVIE